ncbi:carboxypeptidase-like regulatory domain-containing protein [Rhodocytophaga aerolata]|uniref:Carboxypeptidase-like regulatory domain-containing protein n=1 Tax=Rhodocytophaga aerolata TaxID=455078 RepID=A0ABT8RDK2_9BACT|nr:carboxypeptidase-like regulatory domain-containing protein [Rhodocytophaga aerolata]MDO1450167.1 carboxypeptidase-like regulatory domain-containing protein [Rhodocytophaga aerolata]
MKKHLLLFTLFALPLLVAAQSLTHSSRTSYYTYIYQLRNEEAKRIYTKDLDVVNQAYFHTAVDSFPTGKDYHRDLPYGHYLFTYAEGGDLVYEFKPISNVQVQLLNNKVDLSILVTDTSGHPIEEATMHLRNKKIAFDKKAGAYLQKRTSRKGLLSIHYQGFTSYHHIDTKNKQPFLRKVKNRIVYTKPVYWVWKPIRDVVKTIRYGYPEGWIRRIAGIFNPDEFREHDTKYRGYMAFNKPLYMPGDTVKFKAFILKKRGTPIHPDLQVVLHTSQGGKTLTTLQPYRKGGYFYEFVLHDSLQLHLDKRYGISLERKKFRSVMYGSFELEAYELTSNSFNLRSDVTTHHSGTPVSLYAQGKDENDLPVADATLQLTITPEQVIHFSGKQAFVKDTLWHYQQKLDPVGETKIVLPDSIFPAVSLDYSLHAVFLNSNNERHYQTLKLHYIHSPQEINLTLDKDSLLATYLVAGKPQQVDAQLSTWLHGQEKPEITMVKLPFKKALNPYAFNYECRVKSLTKSFFLREEDPLLQCYSQRTADSLFISVDNPRKLPFYYTIYRKNQAIDRGTGNTMNFASKVTTPGNYFISLQYIWSGEVQEREYSIPFQHNQLTVTVNQPMVVNPGQQAQINILVTDAEGSPAKDVDLTAYAVTRKFKNASAPELPYMGKTYKSRKGLHQFDLDHKFSKDAVANRPLDWQYWNPEMGLDSIAYFQFLYPEKGIFTQYISTSDSISLFAPFVVQNGQLLPVYLIYLDNRPIYYRNADVEQRYSFRISSGYHTLKLRTIDKLISIDSVRIKPNSKLVLSVEANAVHPQVKTEEIKKEYSLQEQQLLNRYVMHMEYTPGKNAYLKQGEFIQPIPFRLSNYYSKNTLITGVFMPSPMQYILRDGFTTSFTFEPLYTYEFSEQLLKMRSINPQNFYKYRLHPDYKEIYPNFSEQPYRQTEIDSLWAWQKEARIARKHQYSYATTTTKEFGKLILHQMALPDSAEQRIKGVLLFRKEDPNYLQVYPATSNTFHQLNPGHYKVVLLLYFNEFIETDFFDVQFGGSTYLTIKDLPVQLPTEFSRKAAHLLEEEVFSVAEEKKNLQEVKENYYNTYNITPSGSFTHLITGQVTDSNGEALPGVNVLVKGTKIGTVTNMDGFYQLYVPSNGVLVFSYIGFSTDEILVGSKDVIDAQLLEDVKHLSEVVVVGYGEQRRVSLTGAVTTVAPLQGRVAGVQISDSVDLRGISSLDANNTPLILINGVPYNGMLADIDPAYITKTQVLKGEAAKALYGERARNGVVMITTSLFSLSTKNDTSSKNFETTADLSGAASLRNKFSDYAYWQPRLKTNKQGKAVFNITFPDDVTTWRTFVLAMDGRKRSGLSESTIKAFKPVVSTLAVPRFLVEGDSSLVIGKTMNYTSDTLSLSTAFILNGKTVNASTSRVMHTLVDSLQIGAATPDSVEVSYVSTQTGGEQDGEKRYIPVFLKGTPETKGVFANLDTDTTLTLNFDPALGKVNMYIQGDILQVLLDEIEEIKQYEYDCNEQAASKLIALLLEKKIRTSLGESFKGEQEILKLINKLQSAQRKDGTWGWWPTSSPTLWISSHVTEALVMAQKSGYQVRFNKQALQDYLMFEMENARASDKLRFLLLLKTLEVKVDYPRSMESLSKDTSLSVHDQLQLIELQQQTALPYSLDSLNKYKQTTLTGGMYISKVSGKEGQHLTDNAITNTVIAYRILKASGGHEKALQAIRRYFLERKNNGHWRNTYESALILTTILPDVLTKGKLPASTLTLQGDLQATISNLPYQAEFTPGQPLILQKSGKRPVYVSAFQQYWNALPGPVEKDFIIQTFIDNKSSDQVQVKAGKPVKLVVEVEVKQDAEYIMLEVPIPAGCSYVEKRANYSFEVHREYFIHKTSIFCQQLMKGTYQFTIHLLPRYSGTYTLNPAKAQLMYFPVFYGRNALKNVTIK